MKFKRILFESLTNCIQNTSLITVLYGARQVGKSFLINEILTQYYKENDIIKLNGDIISDRDIFDFTHGQSVEKFLGDKKVLFIDEAQRFTNIGINLKIIYDKKLSIKIIVTGSSSLDIASDIHEPLTGRMLSQTLTPISIQEYQKTTNTLEASRIITRAMTYGMYPDILLSNDDTIIAKLNQLASNYLYKDILEYAGIRKSDVIIKLLKLLALQIGSEVSYHELGQQLGLNQETVSRYIDLLEQSFILYKHKSRSTNLRNEVKKSHKIYFWDLGIRNAIINNFSPLDMRVDVGAMRENFVIIERLKYIQNDKQLIQSYFRRNYQQQEIDLVEEHEGKLYAYEIKRNILKKGKNHAEKIGAESFQTINPKNFLDFVI